MSFPPRLIEGHRAFPGAGLRREQDRYRELAESGQSPEIMVIGCCNSRVSPEVIFDARPGELFVVRNVANIVPPYAPDERAHGVSAALEFGVARSRSSTLSCSATPIAAGSKRLPRRPRRCRPATSSAIGCASWRPHSDSVGVHHQDMLEPLVISAYLSQGDYRSRDVLLYSFKSNGRRVSVHWFAGVLQSLCSPAKWRA